MRRPRPVAAALTALAAAASVALAGCSGGKDAVAQGDTFEFVSPGGKTEIHYDPPADRKKIADLRGPDLMDQAKTIDLNADFAGQVVVLNLWGWWCGPCHAESDDLQNVQERFAGKGATVLGIDVHESSRDAPVDFVKDNGLTYPSIWDPSFAVVSALRGFPISVVPSTLVLDRKHRVAAVFLAEVTDTQVSAVVDGLLAEDPAA